MSITEVTPDMTVFKTVNAPQITATKPVLTDYSQVDCNSLNAGFLGLGGERAKCKQAKGEGFFQNFSENVNQGANAVNTTASALQNLLNTVRGVTTPPTTAIQPNMPQTAGSGFSSFLQNPVVLLGGLALGGVVLFKALKK
jgi:hypothetical protein